VRRLAFLVLIAAPALADTRQDVIDLFGAIAAALSEGDPEVFVRAVDLSMPGFAGFAANVRALAAQNDLSSSIGIDKQEGSDAVQVVELDWLLEIRGKDQNHIFERRQSTVKCRLERRGKKWRVVSLDPPAFFAPPNK
jgi:hypothetical protein